MRRARAVVAVLALGLAAAAMAQGDAPARVPALIPTSAFAANSQFTEARISPDGTRIALKVEVNGEPNIGTMDIESRKFIDRMAIGNDAFELEWFRWAGNQRLIFALSGTTRLFDDEYRFTRLYVSDLATKKTTYIGTKNQGLDGDNVLYVDPDGEYVLLQMQQDLFTEPEVRRFPLDGSNTDNDEKVQGSKIDVWQWIADNDGVVRMGLGVANRKLKLIYRKTADEDFRTIAKFSGDEDEDKDRLLDALRIMSGSDEGLTLDKGPSGKVALRKINYLSGESGEVVYENKDWDIDDFAIDDDGKPVAAYYTDDRDRIVWLEPNMAKQQRRLDAALAGKEVWITSRSKDDSRMIVWQGSASDPGAYYLFTPGKNSLVELAELRPGIPLQDLAPVKPVSYAARDGTAIHAYLALPLGREAKALPLIILPHGGPYGVRDKLDYSDEVQLLANRGYAVLQPNYRGSGGYGEEFEKLGDGQIGRAMQDDLDDAMDWAVAQGFADKDRVCVVGSSYGGYAALWAVTRNPERYRCAASFAGVTDFARQLRYNSSFLSKKGNRAWRTRVRGEDRKFDLDAVSPARQVKRLTRPILLAHGKLDSRVPFGQFKEMRSALEKADFKQADYLTFDEEGHGFEAAADEQKWFDALEAFLKKHNPPD